jgi:DNA-binding beta-propeller fold protein YncE
MSRQVTNMNSYLITRKTIIFFFSLVAVILISTNVNSIAYGQQQQQQQYTFVNKWGTQGTGDGQLNNPTGIAIDRAGNVYISDYLNNNAQKFTKDGTFILKFGVGSGQFLRPFDITIDSSGNVYLADQVNQRIQKFTSDGRFITSWGVSVNPTGIAIDSSDNVYVAVQFSHYIAKFTSDGVPITSWGSPGTGNGQFEYPRGIAVDSSNNVYVTDIIPNTLSYRVQKFASDGRFITSWGSLGSGSTSLNFNGYSITIDSSNNVYVADSFNNRVQKFTDTGSLITEFGTSGNSDGQFNFPHSVAVDPSTNNVFVTDLFNSRVQVFTIQPANNPPSHTSITSATDGNGKSVQDGDSTVSTSITFQVSATQGSNPIAGFECSLDGSSFSTCGTNTSPTTVSYNNLIAGQHHTFKVRAVDTQGNKDPSPATFSWTILTPSQAVRNIINTIDNMHLSRGVTTSLEAPLNTAQSQLNRNNYAAACNTLDAFLQQVKAKEDNGQLTSQQAADLRQQAISVESSIGCSSTTTTTTATTNNEDSIPASSAVEQSQEQSMINLRKLTEKNMLLSSSLNEIAKEGK